MFRHILLPISSEFYPRQALERALFIADSIGSAITVMYIIERKTINQTDKLSDAYRTTYEREETAEDITEEHKNAADNIVFTDAKNIKTPDLVYEEKVVEGEYSTMVQHELSSGDYDLVMMGFQKQCILNYRILDDAAVPVWVEAGGTGSQQIIAVCTNLGMNTVVPRISAELADALGWDLHVLYVVDTEDSVQVDTAGERSKRKPVGDLTDTGERFLDAIDRPRVTTSLVTGSLPKEMAKAARQFNASLVVVGQQQKKRLLKNLGKSTRRKIAETCEYSVLFVG
ncbi:MAG: universal stress protein [Candidatus Thermoplasmatota archaeon]|nr:universal stress protein [Candidatus Thermoplasmatota archaeon]